ncbi:RCC1 domain-containing protein [Shewanella waksmanii]|uniref:RCC1 domain-containing protein n=1 Tax=Shewanella waksmanii TaxID=213783 RepID=UPI000490A40C|nr:hypothetical protein [Shewanella waksmanii]
MHRVISLVSCVAIVLSISGCNDSSDNEVSLDSPPTVASNGNAFVALHADGTITAWGNEHYGGNIHCGFPCRGVANEPKDVIQVASISDAFATVNGSGSVNFWGMENFDVGYDEIKRQLNNVSQIVTTSATNGGAFAAMKQDGTVVLWGASDWGAHNGGQTLENISSITASYNNGGGAFAAIKLDGTVITWGNPYNGGDSGTVSGDLHDVISITATGSAFAALKRDGTVVVWGNEGSGGDASSVASELNDVVDIIASEAAFSALTGSGDVISWGNKDYGGDPHCDDGFFSFCTPASSELTNVIDIVTNGESFVAIKSDGSAVSWGNSTKGGNSSDVQSQLVGVTDIAGNSGAYAAITEGGKVVAWGNDSTGGDPYCDINTPFSDCSPAKAELSDVVSIVGNNQAFAAITASGNVLTWGDASNGGDPLCEKQVDFVSCAKASSALTEVIDVVPSRGEGGSAFAAIKSDNSIIAWGNSDHGGKQ